MAKGENIFKRKDGRWEARYIKGHELSGKIKYGYCYGKTYREAKEKVTKCKAAIIQGINIERAKVQIHFSFYCDEWLYLRKTKVKESTYVKYDTALNKHIKPKLGDYLPLDLTTKIIDDFTKELLFQEKLAPKTVYDILVILRGILKYTKTFFTGIFPNIEITYPKINKKEMRVLTKEEQTRFISYLWEDMDFCKFGVFLAIFTGMRIGELCALQWKNISLKEKTIHISTTMQRLHNMDEGNSAQTKIMIDIPKTDHSVRTIPMLDLVCDLCQKMDPQNEYAYVLTGNENFMEPRLLQYRIKKYTKACGLECVHFHTLRHTFATRAVEAGFEIKSLSEILGHATTTITLERYVHTSMEVKRANMNKLKTFGYEAPSSEIGVKK